MKPECGRSGWCTLIQNSLLRIASHCFADEVLATAVLADKHSALGTAGLHAACHSEESGLDCTEVTEVSGRLNFPAQIQAMIPLPSYNQVCECASFPTSDTSICFTFLRFECFFVIALARGSGIAQHTKEGKAAAHGNNSLMFQHQQGHGQRGNLRSDLSSFKCWRPSMWLLKIRFLKTRLIWPKSLCTCVHHCRRLSDLLWQSHKSQAKSSRP